MKLFGKRIAMAVLCVATLTSPLIVERLQYVRPGY